MSNQPLLAPRAWRAKHLLILLSLWSCSDSSPTLDSDAQVQRADAGIRDAGIRDAAVLDAAPKDAALTDAKVSDALVSSPDASPLASWPGEEDCGCVDGQRCDLTGNCTNDLGSCDSWLLGASLAELDRSPRADLEAEALALRAQGTLVASDAEYDRVVSELAELRGLHPGAAAVRSGLDLLTLQIQNDTFDADHAEGARCLNLIYGAQVLSQSTEGDVDTIALQFTGIFDMQRLHRDYAAIGPSVLTVLPYGEFGYPYSVDTPHLLHSPPVGWALDTAVHRNQVICGQGLCVQREGSENYYVFHENFVYSAHRMSAGGIRTDYTPWDTNASSVIPAWVSFLRSCVLPSDLGCGDGVVDATVGEDCDNGTRSTSAFCTESCRWREYCYGAPEQCSGGLDLFGACTIALLDDPIGPVCNEIFLGTTGGPRPVRTCGDGVLEGGYDSAYGYEDPYEQCDDGNTESGDGCSDKCELEYACSGMPPEALLHALWPADEDCECAAGLRCDGTGGCTADLGVCASALTRATLSEIDSSPRADPVAESLALRNSALLVASDAEYQRVLDDLAVLRPLQASIPGATWGLDLLTLEIDESAFTANEAEIARCLNLIYRATTVRTATIDGLLRVELKFAGLLDMNQLYRDYSAIGFSVKTTTPYGTWGHPFSEWLPLRLGQGPGGGPVGFVEPANVHRNDRVCGWGLCMQRSGPFHDYVYNDAGSYIHYRMDNTSTLVGSVETWDVASQAIPAWAASLRSCILPSDLGCGNDVVDAGEECDLGAAGNYYCSSECQLQVYCTATTGNCLDFDSLVTACLVDLPAPEEFVDVCQALFVGGGSSVGTGGVCGDGEIYRRDFTIGGSGIFPNEQCDDGGAESGDGCSEICEIEFTCTAPPIAAVGPGESAP